MVPTFSLQPQELEREISPVRQSVSLAQVLQRYESNVDLIESCSAYLLGQISAQCIAFHQFPNGEDADNAQDVVRGDCPLDHGLLENLGQILQVSQVAKPIVVNQMVSNSRSWPFPEVRQAIVQRIRCGKRNWGYLSIFNKTPSQDFNQNEIAQFQSAADSLQVRLTQIGQMQQTDAVGEELLQSLLNLLKLKDIDTYHHSLRVAETAMSLAEVLGCSAKERRLIYLGGLVHDIGKLAIHTGLLVKQGELTVQELLLLRQHSQLGHDMLRYYDPLQDVLPIVLYHHEQPDGGGYPLGLVGESIPWQARLVAVADSYDALTQDRPYRRGRSHRAAKSVLLSGSGMQWDAKFVKALISAEDRIRDVSHKSLLNH